MESLIELMAVCLNYINLDIKVYIEPSYIITETDGKYLITERDSNNITTEGQR